MMIPSACFDPPGYHAYIHGVAVGRLRYREEAPAHWWNPYPEDNRLWRVWEDGFDNGVAQIAYEALLRHVKGPLP